MSSVEGTGAAPSYDYDNEQCVDESASAPPATDDGGVCTDPSATEAPPAEDPQVCEAPPDDPSEDIDPSLQQPTGASEVANAPGAAPTEATQAPDGGTYDQTKPTVPDSTKLPGDSKEILDKFTQLNGPPGGEDRCGSATVVAGAVANGGGKEGAAKLAENLAQRNDITAADKKEFQDLAKKIRSGDGTYGDLGKLSSKIQDTWGEKDHTTGRSSMSGETMSDLMKTQPINATKDTTNWKNGESWPMKVDIKGGDDGNHWVLAGKDKAGNDYVYNPMPKDNGQTSGSKEYLEYLKRHQNPSTGFPSY